MNLKYFLYLPGTLIMLGSCSAERKLAQQYVEEQHSINIVLTPTNSLSKDNLTIEYDTAKYDMSKQDSIAWAQSNYIKNISDSTYLTVYTNSLIKELSLYKCKLVLGNEHAQLPENFSAPWFVQIAQLQLLESYMYTGYTQTMIFDELIKNVPVPLYKIAFDVWFKVHDKTTDKKILHDQNALKDNYNVIYMGRNSENTIRLDDIYMFAKQLGKTHAQLLYDYFMNTYIQKQIPNTKKRWFHYDREYDRIRQAGDFKFNEIPQKAEK